MKRIASALAVCFIAIIIAILASCASEQLIPADPAVVQAFTSGEISNTGPITVVFSRDILADDQSVPTANPVFLSPKVDGHIEWISNGAFSWYPDEPLKEGKEYRVEIRTEELNRELTLMAGSDADLISPAGSNFSFSIRANLLEFTIVDAGLSVVDDQDSEYRYWAKITTSDSVAPVVVQNSFRLQLDRKQIAFTIDETDSGNEFTIRSDVFLRSDREAVLELSPAAMDILSVESIDPQMILPPNGVFEVLAVRTSSIDNEYVEIQFSGTIDKTQDFRGVISQEFPTVGSSDLSYAVRGNSVRVYKNGAWPKDGRLAVSTGLRTTSGLRLVSQVSSVFRFPSRKPEVSFLSDGVIFPSKSGAVLPIETVNLSAVMVEAIQIFPENAHQFFQVNKYDGNAELNRVGEVVWRKVIDLEWSDENIDRDMTYGLDLSPLTEQFPGGFFHIRVTFRPPHIVYPCSGEFSDEMAEFEGLSTEPEADDSFWDYWSSSNSYSYRRNRTNPCHPAYYQRYYDHNITIGKNVMVTDIGLTAREDSDGEMHVFASSLTTARPMTNVNFSVYSFAQRELASGRTDISGMGNVQVDGDAFFLLAEKSGEYGYLRVDDGSRLSTSQFDSGGIAADQGMIGYIFGERGVWRPGDQMYLTFLLKDKFQDLPEDMPVRYELVNPFGTVSDQAVLSNSLDGMYHIISSTPVDGSTGNWLARFTVGNRTFTKSLRIETVKPNRLKIEMEFDDTNGAIVGREISGSLHSEWLHGARAGGLHSEIDVSLTPGSQSFTAYRDYIFVDPSRDFSGRQSRLYSGSLNRNGDASFSGTVNTTNAPGVLNATFTTRVYEDGSSFSSEYFATQIHPYEQYVGIKTPPGDVARGMLLTDEDHEVDIVLVDPDGRPVDSGQVNVELYKIRWRWWWETGDENLAGYFSNRNVNLIDSEVVDIRNGQGTYNLRVEYPSWGRYFLRVTDKNGAHQAGKILYIDWPGWAGRAQDAGEGAAMLVLASDKSQYEVGESIEVTFPSSDGGRAAISIESNGKLIHSEWISTGQTTTRYRFRASDQMSPNVYVHISYIQPYETTANDVPIRQYGMISLGVENPDSHLEPVIGTFGTFSPNSTARITISERNRNAMTYRLMVVDEGLLGLTRFTVPQVWNEFYRKVSSALSSWDYYNFVAGRFGEQLDTLLAVGGSDGEDGPEGRKSQTRFSPVVEVFPPRHLDAGRSETVEVPIGNYVGAVRIMVVAVDDMSFGSAESVVPVRSDLMVLADLPRELRPDETVNVPVSVFLSDDSVRTIAVRMETEGGLQSVGGTVSTIPVDGPGEYTVDFEVKAAYISDDNTLRVTAEAGRHRSIHEIPIEIVPVNPVIYTTQALRVTGGQSQSLNLNLPGIPGTNSITVEVSSIPPLNLANRLEYLLRYPHGCVEQTTSAVFPQLFLDDLLELSPELLARTQSNIQSGIERLKTFQTSSGGLSYWPGQSQPSEWGSNYAGHFLLEARAKGYSVPDTLLQPWIEYQADKANQWLSGERSNKEIQAYRLMTLALAREPDIAAMNRLRTIGSLSTTARLRLAYAFYISGYRSDALDLVSDGDLLFSEHLDSATFGSQLRDQAMAMETLLAVGMVREAETIAQQISNRLSSQTWLSTQESAYALMAMAKLGGVNNYNETKSMDIRWLTGQSITLEGGYPVLQHEVAVENATSGRLTLTNNGRTTLLPRIIMSGSPAAGSEDDVSSKLSVQVRYLNNESRTISNIGRIPQGTDVTIEVSVRNLTNERVNDLALVVPVASGFEIINPRLIGASTEGEYIDVRDSSARYYFDLEPNGGYTVRLGTNASYIGRFYLPAVQVSAMYDNSYQAVRSGRWIQILSD